MTSTEAGARLALSDFHHMLTAGRRLFDTELPTPCRQRAPGEPDLWFSPFRDREQAARRCLSCPFLGRCGFNAVASGATHGVWGGMVLPGNKPAELQPVYARLLEQFERRRAIELGDTPAPALPNHTVRRPPRRSAA